MPQRLAATLLVATEMVAHGVGIDLQDFGHQLGAPAGGQQHDGFDAVGLTLVAGRPMSGAQFGQFVGAQRVRVHAAKGSVFSAGCASFLRKNLK